MHLALSVMRAPLTRSCACLGIPSSLWHLQTDVVWAAKTVVYQNTPQNVSAFSHCSMHRGIIISNIPVCWTSEWWWCWSLIVRPTVSGSAGGSQVTRDWWFCSEYSHSFNSRLHASYTCGHSSHGWQVCSLHFKYYYFIITIISDLLSNILEHIL